MLDMLIHGSRRRDVGCFGFLFRISNFHSQRNTATAVDTVALGMCDIPTWDQYGGIYRGFVKYRSTPYEGISDGQYAFSQGTGTISQLPNDMHS